MKLITWLQYWFGAYRSKESSISCNFPSCSGQGCRDSSCSCAICHAHFSDCIHAQLWALSYSLVATILLLLLYCVPWSCVVWTKHTWYVQMSLECLGCFNVMCEVLQKGYVTFHSFPTCHSLSFPLSSTPTCAGSYTIELIQLKLMWFL